MTTLSNEHRIYCGEVWGGIRGKELNIFTSGIKASLYSRSCDGEGRAGGDVYYFAVCEKDWLTRFVIADVAGHGERVAKTSQWMLESLQENMNSIENTAVLNDLNQQAVEYGFAALATATIAAFNRNDNQCYFSYAGHHPLLVFKKELGEWLATEIPECGQGLCGLPLGVESTTQFAQGQVELSPGDRIFVYTDGIIESLDEHDQAFGEERLIDVLNKNSTESLTGLRENVLDSFIAHAGENLSQDDITFMAIEICPT